MENFLQGILTSVEIKDAIILVVAAAIAVNGNRISNYIAGKLKTDAEKIDLERDRHAMNSSVRKLQLIELQVKEQADHHDNLMAVIDTFRQDNIAIRADNSKLTARICALEAKLAKLRPYMQELTKYRKQDSRLRAHIERLELQLKP